MFTLDDLQFATFDQAEQQEQWGLLAPGVFDEYCYNWRQSVYRFSNTGAVAAARHAEKHNRPPPYSDSDIPF